MDIIEKKIENNIINDTDDNTTTDTHIFQSLLKKTPSLSKPSLSEPTFSKPSFSKPSLSKPSFSKPSCGLIVIDNFYNNPLETRNYILTQEFSVKGNFPGQRTISYATDLIKDIIQKYVFLLNLKNININNYINNYINKNININIKLYNG